MNGLKKWEKEIDRLAERKTYLFDNWLGGQQRIYLPFPKIEQNADDLEIIDFINNLGYEIVNYKKGHAKRPDSKRTIRIGLILSKASPELLSVYNRSPSRISGEFLVVISQNPYDIAKMSTDRRWISCLDTAKVNYIDET